MERWNPGRPSPPFAIREYLAAQSADNLQAIQRATRCTAEIVAYRAAIAAIMAEKNSIEKNWHDCGFFLTHRYRHRWAAAGHGAMASWHHGIIDASRQRRHTYMYIHTYMYE